MSATAIRVVEQPEQPGRSSAPPEESSAIEPLLDLAILQANSRSAYVYRFDRENVRARLVAFAGPAPDRINQPSGAELPARIAAWHWNRRTPLVLHGNVAADWRFHGFPEFEGGGFDGVVSLPLLDSGEAVGLANFCRSGETPVGTSALSILLSLSLPLGALLAASTLRRQLHKATQDLADRKLVERAKGLLQARYHWNEERAYLRLRLLSRRSRVPMREIARQLLEFGPEQFNEGAVRHERGDSNRFTISER